MAQPGKAVVLLSGGLDSSTMLALAKRQGYQVYALSIRYGQRHALEIDAARAIAQQFGALRHEIIDIDLRQFGGSALTSDIEVPKHEQASEIGDEIPVTYVPARNTIFLSFALAWAEVLQSGDIFVGVNSVDYSGYPDCRPEYIEAFERMANLATKAAVAKSQSIKIHTPLISLTKADIIAKGLELGVDYGQTTSCYDPSADGAACGHCDACLLRLRGFADCGVADPVRYANHNSD